MGEVTGPPWVGVVEGGEIHVLGYLMDYQAPWFAEFCRDQRTERRARVHRIADRLDGFARTAFSDDEQMI